MTSRFTPAAKRLSLNFFLSDFTLKSMTDLLGRMMTAAPMSPVSSSVAKSTFSICSSGSGRLGLKSLLCVWMARMSSGDPPAAAISSAAYTVWFSGSSSCSSQSRSCSKPTMPQKPSFSASNSRAK